MSKNESVDEKKIKVSTLAYTVLILIVVTVGIGSVLAYGPRTAAGDKIVAKISKVIPFPVTIVDWRHPIYLMDFENNLMAIEKFYQSQDFSEEGLRVDFTTSDGKKRLEIKKKEILDKMVEDKIIEILAKERGISVSQRDIDQAVMAELNKLGTTNDIKNDLFNSYGWSLNDFKEKVVMANVYQNALAQSLSEKDIDNSKARSKILEAQKELEDGKSFADVAKEYSQGSSREKGGELGWARKDQVAPELQVLFGQESLKKNSIIESTIGFHIVDVEDRKKEGNDDVLQLRQIFVAKGTFADWLQDQKKEKQVWVMLNGFVWDNSKGVVDFESDEMRVFEKDQRSKAQGDASIMF